MPRTATLCLICALCAACGRSQAPVPDWEIVAFQYGKSTYASRYVFADGDSTPIPFGWYFWLVLGDGQRYLVDTGINDSALIKQWNIENYRAPVELLADAGVAPEDITGIVLSHLHADHCDGTTSFPDAPVYVQRREFEAMRKALTARPDRDTANGYHRRHLRWLEELESAGRLILLDGEAVIAPGIRTEFAPYHTAGTQTVIVQTGKKLTYLVPDNAYVWENVEKIRPIGTTVDLEGNRAYLQKLKGLADSGAVIIPSHDPALLSGVSRAEDRRITP